MEQVFSERERRVFSYWDGRCDVWGDPLAIYRHFLAAFDGDPNPTLEQSSAEDPALWVPAVERLVAVVRKVFDLVPFDPATGNGATDSDCHAALAAWQGWMAAKKKPVAASPTCLPSTEPVSSPATPP